MCSDSVILQTLNQPRSLKYGGGQCGPFRDFIANKAMFFAHHDSARVEVLSASDGIANEQLLHLLQRMERPRNKEEFSAVAGHLTEVYAWLHEYVSDLTNEKVDITDELLFQIGYALDSFYLTSHLMTQTYSGYTFEKDERISGWFDCGTDSIIVLESVSGIEQLRGFEPCEVGDISVLSSAYRFIYSFCSFALCPPSLPLAAVTHYRRCGSAIAQLLATYYLGYGPKWKWKCE